MQQIWFIATRQISLGINVCQPFNSGSTYFPFILGIMSLSRMYASRTTNILNLHLFWPEHKNYTYPDQGILSRPRHKGKRYYYCLYWAARLLLVNCYDNKMVKWPFSCVISPLTQPQVANQQKTYSFTLLAKVLLIWSSGFGLMTLSLNKVLCVEKYFF